MTVTEPPPRLLGRAGLGVGRLKTGTGVQIWKKKKKEIKFLVCFDFGRNKLSCMEQIQEILKASNRMKCFRNILQVGLFT